MGALKDGTNLLKGSTKKPHQCQPVFFLVEQIWSVERHCIFSCRSAFFFRNHNSAIEISYWISNVTFYDLFLVDYYEILHDSSKESINLSSTQFHFPIIDIDENLAAVFMPDWKLEHLRNEN